MPQSTPFLTLNNWILWLKAILTAATLILLYLRYRAAKKSGGSPKAYPLRTRVLLGLAVVFSFGVFHNLGTFRGETFVHYGEMFHYYLGAKYFKELGYYDLYNAVIVADTEQDNALAGLPFYTNLKTYQNIPRETALRDVDRVKGRFSSERWNAFKADVAFFKTETAPPHSPGLSFLLMDHGYNPSPVATFVLGLLTNAVPVAQIPLLAVLDVLLVLAMIAIVFRCYGFELGALFSVYFFVNMLSGQEFISGSLLRYDWLFYSVVAVCLLDKGRYAASAFFLTLAAMLRIFPAVLFYGIAVVIFQKARSTPTIDQQSIRFVVSAGVTALVLFLLPAVYLGSAWQPWQDFYSKTELHNSGVYVNHLGFRGIALFEPSHLSLDRFVAAYKSVYTNDIVRHWQDVKEAEFRHKRPLIVFSSLVVLLCVTAIVWKRKASETEGALWSIPLVYATSYLSHYYYAILCLFILLFFRRSQTLGGFVPLCLLLVLNLVSFASDYSKPSPIVFFTSINIYLFICLSAILGFELYANVFGSSPIAPASGSDPRPELSRDTGRRRRKPRAQRK